MIAVCPNCGYVFPVEEMRVKVRCPRCGYKFPILSHSAKW